MREIMMKDLPHNNEHFLADWMAGKRSDAELTKMVGPEAFTRYAALRHAVDGFRLADPDLQKNYLAVKAKKIAGLQTPKVRKMPVYRMAAVAALVLLFAALYQVFVFSNTHATGVGQMARITLPDGSTATMNARSAISFPGFFRLNRSVKLDGQAYFEVRKGSRFTVQTGQGTVQVLGTHFSVAEANGYFEVNCYQGRLRVTHRSQQAVIGAGEAVRFYGQGVERYRPTNPNKPEWLQSNSSFRNAPLEFVFMQLSARYGKPVAYPERLKSVRFTGSFTHNDLETALRSVCIPLQKSYRETSDGSILISE